MNAAVIAITPHGLTVARKIQGGLKADLYAPATILDDDHTGIISYETTTKKLLSTLWEKYDSLIFIMALGIVNRIIQDYLENKHKDPAVVVVDEMGRYAISALSGHEGGANRVAEKVALICQGDFVITTGSEAIKTLIAGMGCRRGVSPERLEETLRDGVKRIGRKVSEVRVIVSVEDKNDEPAFYKVSEALGIPLKFISKSLIKTVEENFSKSELVKKTLGVYGVAEPCAMLGGFRCQLLLPKIKMNGTTIAIAEERFL